jgi:hypothetical protein
MKLNALLLPVATLESTVSLLQDVLGLTLKFRDADRYAAFVSTPLSLTLASDAERIIDKPALVIQVERDIELVVDRLTAAGILVVRPIEKGPHELRTVLEPLNSAFQLVITQKLAN